MTNSKAEFLRAALTNWLQLNNLNSHSVASKAGFSVGSLYNFLDGRTASLSLTSLIKIAEAYNCTIDEIVGRDQHRTAKIVGNVGTGGRVFTSNEIDAVNSIRLSISHEKGELHAAKIDGDCLSPIPSNSYVIYLSESEAPETLIGKLALVKFSGGGDYSTIRTIRKGTQMGLYSLFSLSGSAIEDVEISSAKRVISFEIT